LLSINQPTRITLDQGSAMAGGVSLPCRRLAFDDRAASTGFDDSATTDSVADACYCPAIHECCACACFYGAFAMDRATMTMAYEYDGFHLQFPFFG
jgi:hypothetical protein